MQDDNKKILIRLYFGLLYSLKAERERERQPTSKIIAAWTKSVSYITHRSETLPLSLKAIITLSLALEKR